MAFSGTSVSLSGPVLYGATFSDQLGSHLRTGDLNGDGIADLIAGSPLASPGTPPRVGAGAIYVWFGKSNLAGKQDVEGVLGAPPDVTIMGTHSDSVFWDLNAVALGDVNGDGIIDLLLGADRTHGPAEGRVFAGEAYIIFGRQSPATFPAVIDLEIQGAGGADVTIYGSRTQFFLTAGGMTTGDVNGDGVADILLGARGV